MTAISVNSLTLRYGVNGDELYCASCVEDFDTDKILLVCGFCEVIELLRELGAEIRGES